MNDVPYDSMRNNRNVLVSNYLTTKANERLFIIDYFPVIKIII